MEVHQQASIFFLSLTIPTVEDIEKATETTILKKKISHAQEIYKYPRKATWYRHSALQKRLVILYYVMICNFI